ncbi:MAG: DMT family transporter [Tabrizicola sp.]|nr:DMT family transporter [Tabrizicola sp.]
MTPYRLGLLLTTASAIAWSTAGLFTRLIPRDAWTLLAWRGIFGALGIGLAILILDQSLAGFRRLGWQGWLYAAVSGLGMILFITALRFTTVAHVAVIYAAVPFVAAALDRIVLRQRPGRAALSASAAALIGVVVMVGAGGEGSLFGDALAFGMTLSMAAMMVAARRFPQVPALHAACLSALLSALAAWPLSQALAVSGGELVLLAGFGLVNSALGLTLFTLGARLLPAVETALIGALDAPLAPVWVWIAFGETPGSATRIGGAIVFVAVAAHLLIGAQKPPGSLNPR